MIFINYRKETGQSDADRVASDLKEVFGKDKVFKDDHDIKPGEKWPKRLREEVLKCDVLLAIIDKRWLTVSDEKSGRRRLDSEDDWVRQEICTAIEAGKKVIVLLMHEALRPEVLAAAL